jgi:hypothetical protein
MSKLASKKWLGFSYHRQLLLWNGQTEGLHDSHIGLQFLLDGNVALDELNVARHLKCGLQKSIIVSSL